MSEPINEGMENRRMALKAAVEYFASGQRINRDEILPLAERFERWLNRPRKFS